MKIGVKRFRGRDLKTYLIFLMKGRNAKQEFWMEFTKPYSLSVL
jgi:hypothetical protein